MSENKLEQIMSELAEKCLIIDGGVAFFESAIADDFWGERPVDLVLAAARSSDSRLALKLLLSTPVILDLVCTDFIHEMLVLHGPRPEPRPERVDLEGYEDFVFVHRYLGVNGLRYYLGLDLVDVEQKERARIELNYNWFSLWVGVEDLEFFDGSDYVDWGRIERVCRRLEAEGRLPLYDNSALGEGRFWRKQPVEDWIGADRSRFLGSAAQ